MKPQLYTRIWFGFGCNFLRALLHTEVTDTCLIGLLPSWLTNWLTDWLTDWLDWLAKSMSENRRLAIFRIPALIPHFARERIKYKNQATSERWLPSLAIVIAFSIVACSFVRLAMLSLMGLILLYLNCTLTLSFACHMREKSMSEQLESYRICTILSVTYIWWIEASRVVRISLTDVDGFVMRHLILEFC